MDSKIRRACASIAEARRRRPRPWLDAPGLPWADEDFSAAFLRFHELPPATAEDEASYLADLLVGTRNGRVVEVGCGGGRTARALVRRPGLDGLMVVGVDVGPAPLRLAARRCGRRRASFVRGDMGALPLASASFDVLFCVFGGFVHLRPRELARALGEWRRVLVPDGLLLLEYPPPSLLRSLDGLQEWWTGEESFAGTYPQLGLNESLVVDGGRCLVRRDFVVNLADGSLRVFAGTSRIWEPEELIPLVDGAGFRTSSVAGDWDGSLFDESSPRVVLLARRGD